MQAASVHAAYICVLGFVLVIVLLFIACVILHFTTSMHVCMCVFDTSHVSTQVQLATICILRVCSIEATNVAVNL